MRSIVLACGTTKLQLYSGDRSVKHLDRTRFRISLEPESLIARNKYDARLFLAFPELPETMSIAKSVNYADEVIPGWSEPLVGWSSCAATTIDFTVKFVATGENTPKKKQVSPPGSFETTAAEDVGQGVLDALQNFPLAVPMVGQDGYPYDNTQPLSDLSAVVIDEVLTKAEWLLALTHPQYDNSGKPFPPPIVWLEYGQNFRRRGVLKSVTLTLQGPWHPVTLLCQRIDAAVSFQEINRGPVGYSNVRRGIHYPESNLNQSIYAASRPNKDILALARYSQG